MGNAVLLEWLQLGGGQPWWHPLAVFSSPESCERIAADLNAWEQRENAPNAPPPPQVPPQAPQPVPNPIDVQGEVNRLVKARFSDILNSQPPDSPLRPLIQQLIDGMGS